jgi:MFS family permease
MDRSMTTLLPIIGMLFISYLVIGLALPVLPLHVHHGLGLSTLMVGVVAGSQFAAALLSRMWAGYCADNQGPKFAVVTGLAVEVAAGLSYLLSLQFAGSAETSVIFLLLGRVLLGVGESFVITGALSWGLARMGAQHTGKVMSWLGTALYAAFAIGAPVGTALYAAHGFYGIALAATVIPFVALLIVARLGGVATQPRTQVAFREVAGAVWFPGLGLALSGVGFGAITTFIALLFADRGWDAAWIAFTALSIAFIAGRALFGHLPDKIGGSKVALVCILIEAFGLALIWIAPATWVALLGVTLSGLGYSLVYPGLGVEALRRAPARSRGLAMGAYTAFLDLTLGLASPALGYIAGATGLTSVFIVSTLVVLSGAVVAVRLMNIDTSTTAPNRTAIECHA